MQAADGTHSVLSPSKHDMWGNCAGALAAAKHITERRTNEAAALGTAKHAISEWLLTNEHPERGASCCIGQTVEADGFKFQIDATFAEHVDAYVNYVLSRPGKKLYEVKLSTSHIFGVPGQSGTSDCIHKDYAAREIEVIDAKFGYVPVAAEHKQLRDYGASALTLFDLEGEWETVRCTIVQPQDGIEQIKSTVYTRAEIAAYIEAERPKAQLAFKLWNNPPADLRKFLTPSDTACAWCPVAGACAARSDRIVNMFEDVTAKSPDVVLLSDERLGELRERVADILEWAKAIDDEALARALQGRTIPGNKLIYGRKGNRAWIDGAEKKIITTLEMTLGDDKMYEPRKLLSPTQVQEALKAAQAPNLYDNVKEFITQSEPRLKLVPLAAKGDAVSVADVATQFGVVK